MFFQFSGAAIGMEFLYRLRHPKRDSTVPPSYSEPEMFENPYIVTGAFVLVLYIVLALLPSHR